MGPMGIQCVAHGGALWTLAGSHSLSREKTGCVAVSSPKLVEGPCCGVGASGSHK